MKAVIAANMPTIPTVIQNDHVSKVDSGPNLSEIGASKAMAANLNIAGHLASTTEIHKGLYSTFVTA